MSEFEYSFFRIRRSLIDFSLTLLFTTSIQWRFPKMKIKRLGASKTLLVLPSGSEAFLVMTRQLHFKCTLGKFSKLKNITVERLQSILPNT